MNTHRTTLILLATLSTIALAQSASSYNPGNGVTTTSTRNPDGSYTISRTDRAGRTTRQVRPAREPASASTRDRDSGATTSSRRNPDGSHTITRTDRNGRSTSHVRPASEPASASCHDSGSGASTSSRRNPDGSHTITETDGRGCSSTRNRPAREPASASCHDTDSGRTTTATNHPGGRRSIIIRDRSGRAISVSLQPRRVRRTHVRVTDLRTGERAVSFGPPGRHSIIRVHRDRTPHQGVRPNPPPRFLRRGIVPALNRALGPGCGR